MDIGTLTGAIELDDQLSPLITKIEGNLHHFTDAVTDAFGTAGIVVGGFVAVVVGLGAAIIGLGEKGSTLNDVEASFNRLAESAGTTGDVLRENLSEGVRGTVGDMTLMQTTTRLLSSGMKLTGEEAKLMGEASRALGKATGTDAAGGLSILSGALTTGRVRALQAQGVIVDLKGAEEAFAKTLGVTASELNREGKLHADRIAILQATRTWVDRVGVSELSFKERILQTRVALEEWGASLAKSVAASPQVLAAYDAIKEAIVKAFGGDSQSLLNTIVGWINNFADAVTTYGPPIIQTIADIWHGIQDVWAIVKQAWSDVPEWFKNIARDAGIAGVSVYAVSQALGGIGGTDVLGTLANIAQIWGTWASVLPKAYLGVVNLTTAWYLEATAAGTAAAATGLVVMSLAAVVIPLAATYKVVQALSIAWDLWTQKTQASKDAIAQTVLDQRNLALASEIAGTKITDIGKAMQILRDRAADLRGETSPMIRQQREVGVVIGTTIDAVKGQSLALGEAGSSYIDTGNKAEAAAKKLKETNLAIVEARKEIAGLAPTAQATADAAKKVVEPLAQLETELALAARNGLSGAEALKQFGSKADSLVASASAAHEKVGKLTAALAAQFQLAEAHKAEQVGTAVPSFGPTTAEPMAYWDALFKAKETAETASIARSSARAIAAADQAMKLDQRRGVSAQELARDVERLEDQKALAAIAGENRRFTLEVANVDKTSELYRILAANHAAAVDQMNADWQAGIDLRSASTVSFSNALNTAFAAIGPALQRALEGGGNIIKSVGSAFGGSLTQSIFGGKAIQDGITNVFGKTLGGALNSLLPGIGTIAGPLIAKLTDVFKNIFGGPNAKELAGRSGSDALTSQLSSALDWQQQIEVHQLIAAGNSEKWATQMVGLNAAYAKAGHTAAEVGQDINDLWAAEKLGGNAVQVVVDRIITKMHDTLPDAAKEASDRMVDASKDISHALTDVSNGVTTVTDKFTTMRDLMLKPISIQVDYAMGNLDLPSPHVGAGKATQSDIEKFLRENPNDIGRLQRAFGNITDPSLTGYGTAPGYATGTPFLNPVDFGTETLVKLHHKEVVVPVSRIPEFEQSHMPSQASADEKGNVTIIVQPGAVVVNGANKDPQTTAQEVIRELHAGGQNWTRFVRLAKRATEHP